MTKRITRPRKKMGRKTLYSEEKKNLAINMADVFSATEVEIASVIGVNPSTLKAWKGKYPDFSAALKAAKDKADDGVESALYRSAMGYTHWEEKVFVNKNGKVTRVPVLKHYAPNPTAMIFWLKNRQPGAWREARDGNPNNLIPGQTKAKSFKEFCERANYPSPFPKQEEMRAFTIDEKEPRLLLGSRGYGKTDYAVIMGVAYDIFLNKESTNLLVTKSEDRNAAILEEIKKACELNGVVFEKASASVLRVAGLVGKDHSVASLTIGSSGMRGRHPKRIIMDDPVTPEDDSEATRKKVQRVYNELNKLCSNIVVIGQPVHKFDLYENLRPLVKKMEVPHGSIPELDHDLEAQRAAGVSEESIQASYFLKVISEAGYPLEKVKLIEEFPVGETAVAFIDPSFEGGDYTALSIVKAHFDGVAVKGKLFKRAWYDCIDEMAKEMLACRVTRLCFETNSLGDQPVKMLREVLPQSVGVVGKRSTGHKHSRIVAAGAYASLIHIAKESDKLYIDQVKKYEYGAKNDDAPDSLASALEWIGLIRGKQNA